jgi:hypothetical protein
MYFPKGLSFTGRLITESEALSDDREGHPQGATGAKEAERLPNAQGEERTG